MEGKWRDLSGQVRIIFFVKIGVVYENPLQYSYLDNPMDRGARWATVQRLQRAGDSLVTKPPWPPKIMSLYQKGVMN